MQKRFLIFGGFSAAMAVALGAMGAHFLKSKLESGLITETNLQTFETAVKYQFYHSIAIFMVVLLADRFNDKVFQKAGYCFMLGIVFFSGSLYLLSTANLLGLSSVKWVGPVTPIGGLFFITGWILLALAGLKKRE
ncbi:MAG: DUF423 domain-containing protein [Bacteroidia bacterium]|nr:DUF423 domain-containing protein [Bacteroidia bacterium]